MTWLLYLRAVYEATLGKAARRTGQIITVRLSIRSTDDHEICKLADRDHRGPAPTAIAAVESRTAPLPDGTAPVLEVMLLAASAPEVSTYDPPPPP